MERRAPYLNDDFDGAGAGRLDLGRLKILVLADVGLRSRLLSANQAGIRQLILVPAEICAVCPFATAAYQEGNNLVALRPPCPAAMWPAVREHSEIYALPAGPVARGRTCSTSQARMQEVSRPPE